MRRPLQPNDMLMYKYNRKCACARCQYWRTNFKEIMAGSLDPKSDFELADMIDTAQTLFQMDWLAVYIGRLGNTGALGLMSECLLYRQLLKLYARIPNLHPDSYVNTT